MLHVLVSCEARFVLIIGIWEHSQGLRTGSEPSVEVERGSNGVIVRHRQTAVQWKSGERRESHSAVGHSLIVHRALVIYK